MVAVRPGDRMPGNPLACLRSRCDCDSPRPKGPGSQAWGEWNRMSVLSPPLRGCQREAYGPPVSHSRPNNTIRST